jgi:hypothetical protein
MSECESRWCFKFTTLMWLLIAMLAIVAACQRKPAAKSTVEPLPSTIPTTGATPTPGSDVAPMPVTAPSASAPEEGDAAYRVYLPFLWRPEVVTPTATRTIQPPSDVRPEATLSPTPYPTVDFGAVRTELQASGQELGFAKIGFHVSVGGNLRGLGEWMRRLDEAGVPFLLKSVDYAGPIYEAQELMRSSGVPHVLVFRSNVDVPNYELSPAEAARAHWETHRGLFPPELDRSLVWIETVNEIDKLRSEWLAQFALATAEMTMADGFRWAAFGWATGEPEPQDWNSPDMLAFLRLAGQNPDRVAVALHEYSLTVDSAAFDYPYRVGRFLSLFQTCDQYGIPRPTVLITEWGWEYNRVPSVNAAMRDIEWASSLYAPFPQVRGAAIWHLGGSFGSISDQTQKLIEPVTRYSLTHYFAIPSPPAWASTDPALYVP